ncbi:MAG: carbohydrate porin [Chthoniobacterales bacterium]
MRLDSGDSVWHLGPFFATTMEWKFGRTQKAEMDRVKSILIGFILATLAIFVGSGTASAEPQEEKSAISEWWNGPLASGNWLGLRDTLEDRGIYFTGHWRGNFLAIVDGGLQQRGGFDEEINFDLNADIAMLTRVEALEGLMFTTNVRWRDGLDSINPYAGTDNTFRPSAYTGGMGWRFRKLYLAYTTPELFGIKDFLVLSGGWQVPADLFLSQPESKLFLNQSIRTAKGIGLNAIPWGGSFSTWGGYLKVNPTEWYYAQTGFYLAYPFGNDSNNRGLSFAGYPKDNNSLNGLCAIAETGFTPTIGPSELPGKYAAGFIYWGVENTAFNGQAYQGRFQFYWQADQQLYREPSHEEPLPQTKRPADDDDKEVAVGKSFTGSSAIPQSRLSNQGLYFFSAINYAPQVNNAMPFYVLTGLVYRGFIPYRDNDLLGAAFAYGSFSQDEQALDNSLGVAPRIYQGVLEFDYRIQINRWAYVQPTLQYIIRPAGRGLVENDTIIGMQLGVNF